jgi:hypothetical protein
MTNKQKVCKLTKEQDGFWTKNFEENFIKYGPSEKGMNKADAVTFKELVKKYPQLKKCDKIK